MEHFDAYAGEADDFASTRPFDNDGYMGFDPRLPSQRFDSFGMPEESYGEDRYTQEEPKEMRALDQEDEFDVRKRRNSNNDAFDAHSGEMPPPYHSNFDDELGDGRSPSMSSTFGQSYESRLEPDFTPADDFSYSMGSNGKGFGHDESVSHSEGFSYVYPPDEYQKGGAVLPPPDEMQAEEGFILREWKRKNAVHLKEKAKIEHENLAQIIDAADSFKDAFYEKRKAHCEAAKQNNRDKEKVFLEHHKSFHANAHQDYWKAVAELIPHELPAMEAKARGKKDQKKPTVVINHGPKPGKATDLTRMRQVLVKLKHNPPEHMKPAPPPPPPPRAPPTPAAAGTVYVKSSEQSANTTSASASAPTEKQEGSLPTAAMA